MALDHGNRGGLFSLFGDWPEPSPRKSDCPHCTWYNPQLWTKFRYQARIDHMVSYHHAAVPEEITEAL